MPAPMARIDDLTRSWAGSRRRGQTPTGTAVVADSRQVTPGALFVAIPGFAMDGHQFIPEALQRGAVAIVYQNPQAGMDGWCEPSTGRPYADTLVDLSAWAGQSVRVRWRLGTDSSLTREGWYVDDIRVHACEASSAPQPVLVFAGGFESAG